MHLLKTSIALAVLLSLILPPAQAKSKDEEILSNTAPTAAPCVSWISPVIKPRIALLCIHGLGLHGASYAAFGRRLSRLGIGIYAIDVRGFGAWMKAQGHEQVDFNDCLNDVRTTLQSIRAANPEIPVFLMGESMGGAIALRAAALWPELVDGLISAVPAGDRFKQKKTDLKVALEFLTGPRKEFDIGKQIVDQATQNPKLREDWQSDPLARMDFSAKDLIQFQKFMNENHDSVTKIVSTPVLMVQGNNDKLVKPEGTWELFNEIQSDDKTFLGVPSEHLIFEEQQDKGKESNLRIDRLAAEWILSHLPDSADGALRVPRTRHPQLAQFMNQIRAGENDLAITGLQTFLTNFPNNGEAHFWLGVALQKTGKAALARKEFIAANSLRSQSGHAQEANKYLLSMDPALNASTNGTSATPVHPEIAKGAPTVLIFCAQWCDLCNNQDKLISQAQSMFGKNITYTKVDVENSNNQDLIRLLNVGPIPTVVYLTATGQVSSVLIGHSDWVNFVKGIAAILPKGQAAHPGPPPR